MSTPLRIYLSASISNAHNNAYLAEHFDNEHFHVDLPQKIVPDELSHVQFPLQAYEQCLEMMRASDLGLVLFDAFGRDCAWECGWYAAQTDKLLVGFVESGSIFLRDWMVKGGLDALVTTNPRLYELALQNPILSRKQVFLIPDLSELPAKLKQICQAQQSLKTN